MKQMQKHRCRVVLICLMAMLMTLFAGFVSLAEENTPTRVINVVYDDSGSMVETGGQKVDTWCQAKYAMEVFAALLGEKDTLNIYAMSDYEGGAKPAPRLMLDGAAGQKANVAKVHEMLTKAGNTPFDAVRKAYSDLTEAQADEKWLVVLTDGEFQGVEDIDGFFRQKSPDVRVMFLGMGPNAAGISADDQNGIYFEHAETSKQILEKITGICTRIFNSDRLEVNVSAKTLSFDVPMAELIVFAQGANAEITDITGEDGKVYAASGTPVTVQYSEQAATNKSDCLVDRDLKGCLLTFKDDFPQGNYQLNVSGADTIEVYYKPNVEVAAYLTNADEEEVTDLQNLKAGEYTLTFGLVKAGTTEKVSQSKLLGDVTYSATVTSQGVTQEGTYSSGDKVQLEEGSLVIDVTAHYLEYNTVSTYLDYSIYSDKTLDLTVTDNPEYQVTKDGIQAEKPILVKATLDGRELTEDEWNQMTVPEVQISDDRKMFGEPEVKKSGTPGVYEITVTGPIGGLSSRIYESCPFTVHYDGKNGEATWTGETDGVLNMKDQRTLLQRFWNTAVRIIRIAVIVGIILGYTVFKPRFPKTLVKCPYIEGDSLDPRFSPPAAHGKFEIDLLSRILPYTAQKGELKFVPPGVSGVAKAKLKAARDGGAWLTNPQDFIGKDIAFNGNPIPENAKKKVRFSVRNMITCKKDQITYTCYTTKK